MKKAKTHLVLTIIDIIAMLVFWWGCHDISRVFLDIDHSIASVAFSNRIGFFILGIGLLLGHIFIICDHLWHDFFAKRSVLVNYSFIIFGIVLFTSAIFISLFMQHYVEKAGYQYCDGASGVSALAKELVYTRDDEICHRMTMERREMLGLPPR